jgi:hypothetical protein
LLNTPVAGASGRTHLKDLSWLPALKSAGHGKRRKTVRRPKVGLSQPLVQRVFKINHCRGSPGGGRKGDDP